MATLVIAHSHVQLHYNTQAEKQGMVARLQKRSKMLPDVGMVKMYSKSVHVNDLGFAWTGWSHSLHGPALLVPTFFLSGGFTLQVHTAPSLHPPLFLEETFYTPL